MQGSFGEIEQGSVNVKISGPKPSRKRERFNWCSDCLRAACAKLSKFLKKSWEKRRETQETKESLEDKFEREVMKHAKGSISTVLRNPQPAARNPTRD